MLLPGLGAPEVPATIRLALLLALTALLLPVVQPGLPPLPEEAAGTAAAAPDRDGDRPLARPAGAAGGAGPGPGGAGDGADGRPRQPAADGSGARRAGHRAVRLFGLAATVLVLATGLYALPLRALAESYALLPAGAALPLAGQVAAVAQAVADSLALALRLAAPLVLASVLGQFALGPAGAAGAAGAGLHGRRAGADPGRAAAAGAAAAGAARHLAGGGAGRLLALPGLP